MPHAAQFVERIVTKPLMNTMTAASHATKAIDYLHALQPTGAQEPMPQPTADTH